MVGLDALAAPENGSVVTIGTFDGVHIGHRALIAAAIQRAQELEASSVALTWDRHPNATLRPDRVPPLLTTPERKIELLEATGIDTVAVLPFDTELSKWPPERFATDVLAAALGARAVIVGADWRFGHKAAGDVPLLERLGKELGFEVDGAPLIEISGRPVSSSRAREIVAAGDMTEARALLGRHFDLDGVVEHGDDRGAALGWPTANIALDPALAHPAQGVYAGRARVGDVWYSAAVNVGVNPTFSDGSQATPPRVEAYLLDFDGDLYDQVLRVELWERLRDERRFESAEALAEQIRLDVERTRALTC